MAHSGNTVLFTKGRYRLIADSTNLRCAVEEYIESNGWREVSQPAYTFIGLGANGLGDFLDDAKSLLKISDYVTSFWKGSCFRLYNYKGIFMVQERVFDLLGGWSWVDRSSPSVNDQVWFVLICKLFKFIPILIYTPLDPVTEELESFPDFSDVDS